MTNQNNEKSKNGKRLALILIAILLLVAIAFGAYTYSRYVTRDEGTGSATVAQWGYTVTVSDGANGSDEFGFANDYNSSGVAQADDTDAVISASADTRSNIVAPGANGSMTFSITGDAEVSAQVIAELTSTSKIFITVSGGDPSTTYYYYPVVYSLNNGTSDVVVGSIEEVAAYLTTSVNQVVNPNSSELDMSYTLKWAWAFERTEGMTLKDSTGEKELQITDDDVDVLDTALGLLANGSALQTKTITVNEVKYTISTTATSGYSLDENASLNVKVQQVMAVSGN